MKLGGMPGPDHAWSLGQRRDLHFIPSTLSAAPGGYEAAGDIYIALASLIGHFYLDHFTKTSLLFLCSRLRILCYKTIYLKVTIIHVLQLRKPGLGVE